MSSLPGKLKHAPNYQRYKKQTQDSEPVVTTKAALQNDMDVLKDKRYEEGGGIDEQLDGCKNGIIYDQVMQLSGYKQRKCQKLLIFREANKKLQEKHIFVSYLPKTCFFFTFLNIYNCFTMINAFKTY